MMKKTLLATAVAATLTATAAQAATVFQNDTLKVDTYGRVNIGLVSFDGDNSIEDIGGSRFGFSASNKINDDLTAFANAEFRFKADETNADATTKRNTYVGLSGSFGKVTLGNFDGLYYQGVSKVTDIFQNNGYHRTLSGGSTTNARRDSLAYETNDLSGFKLGLGASHRPEGTPANTDESWNLQAYAQYKVSNDLTLALAFNQASEDNGGANGTDEAVIGAQATYKLDALTTFLLVETQDDLTHFALGASYNYGSGAVYGTLSLLDDDVDSGLDIGLGVDYRFSRNFRTYAEVQVGNDDVSNIQNAADEGVSVITLGARFDW